MSISRLGYAGAEEFLETFTYMYAFDEAKEFVKTYFPKNPNGNPYIEEAKESAIQVVMMGGIFKIIQYQEVMLEKFFAFLKGLIIILMGLAKKGFQKLKNSGKTGRVFKFLSEYIGTSVNEAIERVKVILKWAELQIEAWKNSTSSGQIINAVQGNRQNVVERDRSAMNLAKGMNDTYVNSLLFKLLTKSFKQSDEVLLKKILGRDATSDLSVDDVNKVADFLFVTDSTGKLIGFTEVAYELLNGLGYIHNTGNNPIP